MLRVIFAVDMMLFEGFWSNTEMDLPATDRSQLPWSALGGDQLWLGVVSTQRAASSTF